MEIIGNLQVAVDMPIIVADVIHRVSQTRVSDTSGPTSYFEPLCRARTFASLSLVPSAHCAYVLWSPRGSGEAEEPRDL